MKIEVLHASGCASCRQELATLRQAAVDVDPAVDWHEVDILQAIDYAVELGVLKPPAVAIDGELVFPKLPQPEQLAAAIRARRER